MLNALPLEDPWVQLQLLLIPMLARVRRKRLPVKVASKAKVYEYTIATFGKEKRGTAVLRLRSHSVLTTPLAPVAPANSVLRVLDKRMSGTLETVIAALGGDDCLSFVTNQKKLKSALLHHLFRLFLFICQNPQLSLTSSI